MTPAHDQIQKITLTVHYPEHEARVSDPHHAEFIAARKRLQTLGLLRCVVCSTDQNIELHHSKVEYALQNGVDIAKMDEEFGLHLTDADFAAWIDSPENLEALCVEHHRGAEGIHVTPAPLWGLLRVLKAGFTLYEAKGNI